MGLGLPSYHANPVNAVYKFFQFVLGSPLTLPTAADVDVLFFAAQAVPADVVECVVALGQHDHVGAFAFAAFTDARVFFFRSRHVLNLAPSPAGNSG